MVVLFFALLISYPWEVLTIAGVVYLACLPLGWFSYRNYQRKDAEALAAAASPAAASPGETPLSPGQAAGESDRPARLN
jgi:CDP-diacylglycerol--serine O-phosphatidyltransferase